MALLRIFDHLLGFLVFTSIVTAAELFRMIICALDRIQLTEIPSDLSHTPLSSRRWGQGPHDDR